MHGDLPLHKKLQALIGEQGRFKNEIEMARFLGLGETRHTKLYDFLAGADTRYKAVLDWVYKLGGHVVLEGGEPVEKEEGTDQNDEDATLKILASPQPVTDVLALTRENARLVAKEKALQVQVDELKGALKYADSLIEKASAFNKTANKLF